MENERSNTESRREFLIKAGKLAVYTPPALMLLMHPSRTSACTSAGGKRPNIHWGQPKFNDRFGGFGGRGGKNGWGNWR